MPWTKKTTFRSLAATLLRVPTIVVFSLLLANYSRIFCSLSTFSSTTHCQPRCNQAPDPISPSLSLPFGSIGHIKPLSTFLPCFWDRTHSWSSSCFRHASVLTLLAVCPISSTSLPGMASTAYQGSHLAHSNLQGHLASCPNPSLQLYFSSPTVVDSLTQLDFLLFPFMPRDFPLQQVPSYLPSALGKKSYQFTQIALKCQVLPDNCQCARPPTKCSFPSKDPNSSTLRFVLSPHLQLLSCHILQFFVLSPLP